jgi:hypothetical protein
MGKFLHKVAKAARLSKDPRRTMVKLILSAHGWRNPWRSAAWYPPGSDVTFGTPISVEALQRRGFGFIADQLLSVENMLTNWAKAVRE